MCDAPSDRQADAARTVNRVRQSLIVRLAGAILFLFVLFPGAAMPPEMRRLTRNIQPRDADDQT